MTIPGCLFNPSYARGKDEDQGAGAAWLWRKGEIGEDVLIRLEREIDLAEARLAREE